MAQDAKPLSSPIVLDIGKQSRKRIKELSQGEGPLAEEIFAAIREARGEVDEQKILPVVVLYCKKPRKPKGLLSSLF